MLAPNVFIVDVCIFEEYGIVDVYSIVLDK